MHNITFEEVYGEVQSLSGQNKVLFDLILNILKKTNKEIHEVNIMCLRLRNQIQCSQKLRFYLSHLNPNI